MAQALKESSIVQRLLREGEARGRVEALRAMLLRQGTRRFGSPDAATRAALGRLSDPADLEALGERLLEAPSWTSLLRD